MNDQMQKTLENVQEQLILLMTQQARQEHALSLVFEVIGKHPDLALEFERACLARLDEVAEKSPKAADDLELYLARLLPDTEE